METISLYGISDLARSAPWGAASRCPGCRVPLVVPGRGLIIFGEFDPGSGRTLAACLTHASRTVKPFGVDQWRTGE